MQAAHAANRLMPGPQIKMVSIAENDFSAEQFESVLRNRFHSSLRADGHKDWRFDGLMRKRETRATAACGGCIQEIEGEGHSMILLVPRKRNARGRKREPRASFINGAESE
jgi:hypothetical protein